MTDGQQFQAYEEYLKFKEQILRFGKEYKLSKEICEDVFAESLIVVLSKFNEDRGDFKNFMITVFRNKLKDYVCRERYYLLFRPIEWQEAQIPEDLHEEIDIPEGFVSPYHFFNAVRKELDENDRIFFDKMKDLVLTQSRGLVSEAARSLGLTQDQGWNAWRRIMRKAKRVAESRREASMHSYLYVEKSFSSYNLKETSENFVHSDEFDETVQFPELNFLTISQIEKLLSFFSPKN